MTFALRNVMIGLSVFGAISALSAPGVPYAARLAGRDPSLRRASRLFLIRLLPSSAALVASLIVTLSFFFYEPHLDSEELGRAVPMFAGLTLILAALSIGRGVWLLYATRRTVMEWLATSEPIELPGFSAPAFAVTADFPIVAVLGILRPKLVIARSVLATCSAPELQAVLAHELGHIRRRDNLRRLLIAIAPDPLAWLPAAAQVSASWRDAAEEAADADAAGADSSYGVHLASALVKVARIAAGASRPDFLPTSALYSGESLEVRVRRLLDGAQSPAAPSSSKTLAALCGLSMMTMLILLGPIHEAIEEIIHILP